MNDFDIIKENLPYIDAKDIIKKIITKFILSNKDIFLDDNVFDEIDDINSDSITYSVEGYYNDDFITRYIEIPTKVFTDEKEFEKYVKDKREEKLRLKAEKEAAEKAKIEDEKRKAEEREYKQYLKLKEKYESKGE